MREDTRFAAALAAMGEAANRPCVDGPLLDACDRFCDLWSKLTKPQRKMLRGRGCWANEATVECGRLLEEIERADALTGLGRNSKARVAQCLVDDESHAGKMLGSILADYARPGGHNRYKWF